MDSDNGRRRRKRGQHSERAAQWRRWLDGELTPAEFVRLTVSAALLAGIVVWLVLEAITHH